MVCNTPARNAHREQTSETRDTYRTSFRVGRRVGTTCERGILILPDASEILCRSGILDGISYVVEISKDR